MAEPFKNMIGAELIGHLGRHLLRVWPQFRREAFRRRALRGLDALELKARVRHVAIALEEFLPDDFARAADLLEATLAPARTDTDLSALVPGDGGLAGAPLWPMTDFVARRGLGDPERALQALHAMTQRHTAEFAIRPFLRLHPEPSWAALRRWVNDPSAHVRRLVCEGSRPRLPWGEVLQELVRDPSPTLPLLERLQDDPSDYVRRSVANHLNDIAKDHPEVVAEWIGKHVAAASKQRLALLQRAGRTLIKRGHRGVLGAFGCAEALRGEATMTIAPGKARVGDELQIDVTVQSRGRRSQRLVIDYVVHQVRQRGLPSRKVWKGWVLDLAANERRELTRRHSLRAVTTRRDHPGWHAVELLVNGRVVATSGYELLVARGARRR